MWPLRQRLPRRAGLGRQRIRAAGGWWEQRTSFLRVLTPLPGRATVTVSWAHHGQLVGGLHARQPGRRPPSTSRQRQSNPFSLAPLTAAVIGLVVEGNGQVVEEGEHGLLVEQQAFEQIARGRLREAPALAWRALGRWVAGGRLAARPTASRFRERLRRGSRRVGGTWERPWLRA